MTDGINAGAESDRLLVSWRLDSQAAEAAAAGRGPEPRLEQLRHDGATEVLVVGRAGEPVASTKSSVGFARVLLCEVPEDIVSLRRSDPLLAREWRLALRKAFTEAIDSGYEVSGATRSGWYVLEIGAN
jgi:predicted GNAT superfamily acetyltransferase